MDEKWIRLKLWKTEPYSEFKTTWIVFHKNNPLGTNRDTNTDYSMYVRKYFKDSQLHLLEEASVDEDLFRQIIKKGRLIKIPFLGVFTGTGLDGFMCGIEFPKGIYGFGEYKISWFMDGPEEWEQVVQWFYEVIDFLENNQSI